MGTVTKYIVKHKRFLLMFDFILDVRPLGNVSALVSSRFNTINVQNFNHNM